MIMAVERAHEQKKNAEQELRRLQLEAGWDDEMLSKVSKEQQSGMVDLQKTVTRFQNEQILYSQESQLTPCKYCDRKFMKAALQKHEPVCQTVFGKKRAEFNSYAQRLGGRNPIQLLSNGTRTSQAAHDNKLKYSKFGDKSRNLVEKQRQWQSKSPTSSLQKYTPHRIRTKNQEAVVSSTRNPALSATRKRSTIHHNSVNQPNARTPSKRK